MNFEKNKVFKKNFSWTRTKFFQNFLPKLHNKLFRQKKSSGLSRTSHKHAKYFFIIFSYKKSTIHDPKRLHKSNIILQIQKEKRFII